MPAKGGIFSILSENQTLNTVPESAERYHKFLNSEGITETNWAWEMVPILPYYKIMLTF